MCRQVGEMKPARGSPEVLWGAVGPFDGLVCDVHLDERLMPLYPNFENHATEVCVVDVGSGDLDCRRIILRVFDAVDYKPQSAAEG